MIAVAFIIICCVIAVIILIAIFREPLKSKLKIIAISIN